MTYVIDDQALVITSRDQAEETLRERVYCCVGFIDVVDPSSYDGVRGELNELIDSITTTIAPNTWDDVGGPGAIVEFPTRGLVIVSQTEEVHSQLQEFLKVLQRGRASGNSATRKAAFDPSATSVKVYELTRAYRVKESQKQLIDMLVRMLAGSDNALHAGNSDFFVRVVANNLVLSHRTDAHGCLAKILKKLGAINENQAKLAGGMF